MLIFELIDCDGPNFLQVRQQVLNFLLANEHKCVSLVSHFLKKDTQILYILDERNSIWGVLSISQGGQILHCLESEAVLPTIQEYFSLERPKRLFSIIGEQKYTDAIAKIMLQLFKTLPKASNEYLLMEYNSASSQVPIDPKKRTFLSECEIFCCKDSDFDDLFPIQKAYEFEEVLIDKNAFNEKNSRILLRKSIQDSSVFALRHKNKIVAKAAINAKGENCIQLGGIFTDVNFRNRGIATYLVQSLIKQFKEKNKTIVLFVKKSNLTAINVYKNCGFASFSDYKILYYS